MVAYGIVEPIFRMVKIDAMLLRTGLDLTLSRGLRASVKGLNPKVRTSSN